MLAAGVVEVLARGKNLHRLRSPLAGKLQQSGVQALVQEQVRGQNAQLGHRSPPRRKHGISQLWRSFHCRIFAITYGKPGVAEEGAGSRVATEDAHGEVLPDSKFLQNRNYFLFIENESLKTEQK
jgi:hypothetical protein